MPLTSDQVTSKVSEIYKKKKELRALAAARHAAEQALVADYKINACNVSRSSIALDYKTQADLLIKDIGKLEDDLGG